MKKDKLTYREYEVVGMLLEKSLYDKLLLWQTLITEMSCDTMKSEGLLPDDMTPERFKLLQDHIKSSYADSIWIVINENLKGLSDAEFIHTVFDNACQFPVNVANVHGPRPFSQKFLDSMVKVCLN